MDAWGPGYQERPVDQVPPDPPGDPFGSHPRLLIAVTVVVALVVGSLAGLARDYDGKNVRPLDSRSALPQPKRPAKRPVVPTRGPGTNQLDRCDQPLLVSYLKSHARESAAWSGAFDSDPQFNWRGKYRLVAQDVEPYVRDLVPQVLRDNLDATDHAFTGKPIAVKSVLTSGTAVLTDKTGVARVRCKSGNPLTGISVLPAVEAAPKFVNAGYSRLAGPVGF